MDVSSSPWKHRRMWRGLTVDESGAVWWDELEALLDDSYSRQVAEDGLDEERLYD